MINVVNKATSLITDLQLLLHACNQWIACEAIYTTLIINVLKSILAVSIFACLSLEVFNIIKTHGGVLSSPRSWHAPHPS